MSEQDDDYVKVRFRLPEPQRGWPPVDTEGMWAKRVPDGYELANVPFFARGCAVGDVVAAEPDETGALWAGDVVHESGNCTIRVFVLDSGPHGGDLPAAMARFTALGVQGEGLGQHGMLTLTVAPDLDLAAVVRLLDEGDHEGSWIYEEAWVTPAWHAAR